MPGPIPQVPPHGGKFTPVRRERVPCPPPHQHHRVPHPRSQHPGLVQNRRILTGDEPRRTGRRESLPRPSRPQPRLLPPVPQLKQLHGPLDVGQPAPPQLGVQRRIGPARHPLRLHPGLQPPDLPHGIVPEPLRRIPQRIDQLDEPPPQVLVPGDDFGPQQGLRLPHQRPAPVVRLVRLQRPHERPGLPLGPQIRVDQQRRIRTRTPASSRRISETTEFAAREASCSSTPSRGSCTNSTSASDP